MDCRGAEAGQDKAELSKAESQTTQLLPVSFMSVLRALSGDDSEPTSVQKRLGAGFRGKRVILSFSTHIFKIVCI